MLAARRFQIYGLTKSVTNSSAVRHFAAISPTEEFPHPEVTPRKPTAPKISSIALPSGVRIITREKESGVVHIKFAVLGGSAAETATQKGSAHFLAFNAFAGNMKNSGLRIVRFLESVGATFSAKADREKIVYDVSIMRDRAETAVGPILSIISSPPHDPYVLKESKTDAQIVYNTYNADPAARVNELIHEAAYGEGSALGSSLYAPSLKNLDIREALDYRSAHFLRENLIISASGISVKSLKQMVEPRIEKMPSKGATPAAIVSSPYIGGEVKVRAGDGSDLTHLAVAFPVPAGEIGKSSQVLAGLLASRLIAKGSKVVPFLHAYSKGGLLGVWVNGSVAAATNELTAALHEIKALASSAPETDAAKTKVSLDNFLSLEGDASTCHLLTSVLSGVSPEQLVDARGVTAQSVSAAAATLLKQAPSYAVFGRTLGTPSLAEIKKIIA